MIRNLEVQDLMSIEKLHQGNFPLPEVNDPSYIIQKTLITDSKVVGACFARLTSELILILDPNLSKFSRARLYREVAGDMMCELFKRNIKTTHAFVTPETDWKSAKILEDHLGFVHATGIPMYFEMR